LLAIVYLFGFEVNTKMFDFCGMNACINSKFIMVKWSFRKQNKGQDR